MYSCDVSIGFCGGTGPFSQTAVSLRRASPQRQAALSLYLVCNLSRLLRELVLALAAAAPPIARGGAVPGAFPLDPFEFACSGSEAPCAVGGGRLAVLQRCRALVGQGYLVAALHTEHVDA